MTSIRRIVRVLRPGRGPGQLGHKVGPAVMAAALVAAVSPAASQDGSGPASGVSAIPLSGRASGAVIGEVRVELRNGSGNPARDDAVVKLVRSSLAALPGSGYDRVAVATRLSALRSRIGTGALEPSLLERGDGSIVLLVEVDTVGPDGPGVVEGIVRGQLGDFPVIVRTDRSFVTAILTGGNGVYADTNAWFGAPALFAGSSPIAGDLPGRQATWTEAFVEYGIGGATQLGDSPFYAYGALTGITSGSAGQDIYRDDARIATAVEKAYAGLLYVDPDRDLTANVSLGRQNVTLNDGFLIHFVRGSANIDGRGATYLGARNANDFSMVGDISLDDWALKVFYIDPNELESLESNSTFAGVNLRRTLATGLSLDASLITVPGSDSTFATPDGRRLDREGLVTVSGHGRWSGAFGQPGMWLEGELAHQFHPDEDISTYGGYALIGYRAVDLPWTPSLSYRFSYFSGDDPATARYERFDPLLSTGLGNWLQGINFGKLTSNSNLAVHRLQFNVTPDPRLNITLDWHLLRAAEENNLGSNPALSTLSSLDIGNEFTLSARWAINENLFLQSLGSVALPGRALRDVGADEPWLSLQASLYWTF